MKSVAAILICAIGVVGIIAGILGVRMARMHPQGVPQQAAAEELPDPATGPTATTSPTTVASSAFAGERETKTPEGDAIVLSAKAARVHGYQLHFDPARGGQIVYWVDSREYIEW